MIDNDLIYNYMWLDKEDENDDTTVDYALYEDTHQFEYVTNDWTTVSVTDIQPTHQVSFGGYGGNTILEVIDKNKTVVTLYTDGSIEYGDDYNVEDAAIKFWECMSAYCPTTELHKRIADLEEHNGRLMKELSLAVSPTNSSDDDFDRAMKVL